MSTGDDSNTVIVPDLPSNFLTEHQRILLAEELQKYPETKFGVEHFFLARAFLSNCHSPPKTVTQTVT